MGIMDFIKGQLIEVIEWTDSSSDTIVYRFPVANKEIKMGAMLTVRESQAAVFVNEGILADVFYPGLYELATENMPVLTKLKSWKYGFNSPFKAEVYFVNTKQFIDQKWGTQSPVAIRDPQFGQVEIRARGLYSFRVVDPAKFMRELFGTRGSFKTEDITNTFRTYLVQYLKDTIAESKLSYFDLQTQLIEFSAKVKENVKEKFDQFGLEIVDLTVEDISLPEELQEAFRQGSKIGLVGGIDTYTKIRTLDAINSAAENEGNGSFAGMGAGMGAGAAIGNMMGQMFNTNTQNQQPNQNQQTFPCPKCNTQVQQGAKFCPNCGQSTVPQKANCIKCNSEITPGAKFCPECGASQDLACSKCGTKLTPGAKFCPDCGNKV
jgi:membrane protease subunit (stomatin/prohibitin family)